MKKAALVLTMLALIFTLNGVNADTSAYTQIGLGGQSVRTGNILNFGTLDFGSEGAQGIRLEVGTYLSDGIAEVILDNPNNSAVGSCVLPCTSEVGRYTVSTAPLQNITGLHTVYLKISSKYSVIRQLDYWFKSVQFTHERLEAFGYKEKAYQKINETRDIYSDTWVGTDGLGRALPTFSEVGAPKDNKTIAMFYFITAQNNYGGTIRDISKMRAIDPNLTQFELHQTYYWGEPYFGYYTADDRYVIRRHAQQLSELGVDVIILDNTNGYTYMESILTICDVYAQIRAEGGKTPKIAFFTGSEENNNGAIGFTYIYDVIYKNQIYKDLWFYWEGKPLILTNVNLTHMTDTSLGYNNNNAGSPLLYPQAAELKNFFNWRRCWAWSGGSEMYRWTWLDHISGGVNKTPTNPNEERSVSVAQHATTMIGRSNTGDGGRSTQPSPANRDSRQGVYFNLQWQSALKTNPDLIFVTGWNEWTAIAWEGQITVDGKVLSNTFVDLFDSEYNRDIEPSRGVNNDHTFYQTASNIRKYKGVRAIPKTDFFSVENIAEWENVKANYFDNLYDTNHRNAKSVCNTYIYVNESGRNDFAQAKASYDSDNIYFYVETRENIITSNNENRWMTLYLNTDGNGTNGWAGYDYALNPKTSKLEKFNNNSWVEVGNISYQQVGNKLMMTIDKASLGITTASFIVDFKWVDNVPVYSNTATLDSDIINYIDLGDVAPDGRFNYRLNTEDGSQVTPKTYSHTFTAGNFPTDFYDFFNMLAPTDLFNNSDVTSDNTLNFSWILKRVIYTKETYFPSNKSPIVTKSNMIISPTSGIVLRVKEGQYEASQENGVDENGLDDNFNSVGVCLRGAKNDTSKVSIQLSGAYNSYETIVHSTSVSLPPNKSYDALGDYTVKDYGGQIEYYYENTKIATIVLGGLDEGTYTNANIYDGEGKLLRNLENIVVYAKGSIAFSQRAGTLKLHSINIAVGVGRNDQFTYSNPIAMSLSDPSIVKAGGVYYMTGSNNLGIYSSTNLKDWGFLCNALQGYEGKWYAGGFSSAKLFIHNGKYYLTATATYNGESSIALLSADNIAGPYTMHTENAPLIYGSDASLFLDDDGKTYMYISGIECFEVDLLKAKIVGFVKSVLSPSKDPLAWDTENFSSLTSPVVIKRNDVYYMFYMSKARGAEVGYATAISAKGPWIKAVAPIYGTINELLCIERGLTYGDYYENSYKDLGQFDIFTGPDGEDWIVSHALLNGGSTGVVYGRLNLTSALKGPSEGNLISLLYVPARNAIVAANTYAYINRGETFTLPSMVDIGFDNGEKESYAVQWNGTIDTSTSGIKTLTGTVNVLGTTFNTLINVKVLDVGKNVYVLNVNNIDRASGDPNFAFYGSQDLNKLNGELSALTNGHGGFYFNKKIERDIGFYTFSFDIRNNLNLGNSHDGIYIALRNGDAQQVWATMSDLFMINLQGNRIGLRMPDGGTVAWGMNTNSFVPISVNLGTSTRIRIRDDFTNNLISIYANNILIATLTIDGSTVTLKNTSSQSVSRNFNGSLESGYISVWSHNNSSVLKNICVYEGIEPYKGISITKLVQNVLQRKVEFSIVSENVVSASKLMLAFYDENQKLLGIKTALISLAQGDNTISLDITQAPASTALIKALIWDGTKTMKPISRPYKE